MYMYFKLYLSAKNLQVCMTQQLTTLKDKMHKLTPELSILIPQNLSCVRIFEPFECFPIILMIKDMQFVVA